MSDDLIAALPTSAGKTRIAEICILRAVSLGRRVLFVTPLRALSAQTERNVRRTFTPLGFSVSSLYGSSGTTGDDTDSLGNRDVVVTTPEKLDFALRNNPELIDDVGLIVLDKPIRSELQSVKSGTKCWFSGFFVAVTPCFVASSVSQRSCRRGTNSKTSFFGFAKIRRAKLLPKTGARRDNALARFLGQRSARLTFRVEGETPFVDRFVISEPPRPPRRKSFPSGLQELAFASAWRLVDQGQTVLIYCPQRRSVNALAKTALTLHRQGLSAPTKTRQRSSQRRADHRQRMAWRISSRCRMFKAWHRRPSCAVATTFSSRGRNVAERSSA